MLQLCAHPVVLDGEKDGVEDDAEGDDDVEEGVVDDGVEDVLGLEPAGVVKATSPTAGTVAIVSSFWKSVQHLATVAITGILHHHDHIHRKRHRDSHDEGDCDTDQ